MKNSKVRAMTALLAFLVGVSSSQLRSLWQYKVVRTNPLLNLRVLDQPAIPSPVETWRRIIVKDRFSFYIPPYLNDDGHSVSRRMAVGAFRKADYDMSGLFYIYYYSDNDTERDPSNASHRYRSTTRSEVMLGGKHAIVVTEIPDMDEILCIHDVPEIQVYFPEIGRGQKLYMSLTSSDRQGLEIAKRLLESIEFLSADASNTRLQQTHR